MRDEGTPGSVGRVIQLVRAVTPASKDPGNPQAASKDLEKHPVCGSPAGGHSPWEHREVIMLQGPVLVILSARRHWPTSVMVSTLCFGWPALAKLSLQKGGNIFRAFC